MDEEIDERGIPLTREEMKLLPEHIDSYDDLIEVDIRKDGRAKMLLGKAINGHAIIVETISRERQSIHPRTAFKISTERYNAYWKTKAADRFFKSLADEAAHSGGKNQSTATDNIAQTAEEINLQNAEQKQTWDNDADDTAAEAKGREIAYARLEAENAALHDAVEGLKKLTGQYENTIGRLERRLSLTKTPSVRISDAQACPLGLASLNSALQKHPALHR